MDQVIVGVFGALCVALVGHAGAVWYKIGRVEGKLDMLCSIIEKSIQAADILRDRFNNRKA